jgi:N-acetylmuramoyl-L-alanine amidase
MKLRLLGIAIFPLLLISWKSMASAHATDNLSSNNYIINEDHEITLRRPAREQSEKISSLIFHYTAVPSLDGSIRSLTRSEFITSHWLIPENGNVIYKLVDENKKAYHGDGITNWKKQTNINNASIAIQTVSSGFNCQKGNPSSCAKEAIEWKTYPEDQQVLIINLAKDIKNRYDIDPLCVLGHADIEIGKKLDPGPLFPWKRLAENGVGAWATPTEIEKQIENINNSLGENISRLVVQSRLYEFGYNIKNTDITDNYVLDKLKELGYDTKITKFSNLNALNRLNELGNASSINNNIFNDTITNKAINAFLIHYLPDVYLRNEIPNNKIILATLQALLIKYPNKGKNSCNF